MESHCGSVESGSGHDAPVTELGHSDSVGVGALPDVIICTHALGAHVVRVKRECTMGSREECGLAVIDHCVVISDDCVCSYLDHLSTDGWPETAQWL